jgi:ribonucleotide reductase beta subunit family protein with ferritin-like domain
MHVELLKFQDKSKWRSLYEKSKKQYWQPEAVDCQPDKNQWLTLDKALKRKVMALLQYAIILDSYQVSNLQKEGQAAALSGDPMLSALLSFHSLMEVVHSQSYSYWAETVCTPKQKTWLYQQSEQAENRMSAYENLLNTCDSQLANYFLEGVSFQALFRLSDQLKSEGLLFGLSAILNLIKRDEATHIETFQYLLTPIIKTFDDRTKTFWASEFKTAVEYEAQQIAALSGDQLLSDYVLYAGELRAKAIGLLEKMTVKNPLKHLESYNDTSKQNLKANFFTSNVMYEQRDETLDWNTDTWF